jgi:chitodextrinase
MTRTPLLARRALPVAMLATLFGAALSAQSPRLPDRTPPTAPTNLVATATTETSVTLAWGPATDNSGRFSYLICCAGTTVTVSQTVTTHTLTGLQPGKTYILRVYAKDAAGNLSKSSNAVTVTLPGQVAAPTKPVVERLSVGPTHASLRWMSTDNGSIIWYTIYVDGEAVSTLNSRTATFTCAAVLVPTGCVPLDQNTTYTFTVRARDVDGNWSPVSDPLVVTTEPANPNDHTPPTQPAELAAEDLGGHFLVTWSPSSDDFAPQSLIRYDVHVNGELRAVVVGNTAVEIEADAGSVIAVVAVDTADNESEAGTIGAGS